jgi:hypothetical protein
LSATILQQVKDLRREKAMCILSRRGWKFSILSSHRNHDVKRYSAWDSLGRLRVDGVLVNTFDHWILGYSEGDQRFNEELNQ